MDAQIFVHTESSSHRINELIAIQLAEQNKFSNFAVATTYSSIDIYVYIYAL